jgi:uncharacterized Zn finger protein
MTQLTRTWWGKRFIEALEDFSDPARLSRGRSYALSDRIRSWNRHNGKVTAKIEGNINPYFGVYKKPIYNTVVEIKPIPPATWRKIIERLASKASLISQLLLNEIPDNIEENLADLKVDLLPRSEEDFITNCSCPDYWNPCKHIAGLCYFLAKQLDQDPFLLFELRGLTRSNLNEQLSKTPLGKILATTLEEQELSLQPVDSYYPRPHQEPVSSNMTYHAFWKGEKPLPSQPEPLSQPGIPAIPIRKGGDYPAFWHQNQSFIEVMIEFYERVRKRNKDLL